MNASSIRGAAVAAFGLLGLLACTQDRALQEDNQGMGAAGDTTVLTEPPYQAPPMEAPPPEAAGADGAHGAEDRVQPADDPADQDATPRN